jgi:uncharacterized protein YbaR (Trm112 family)
MITDQASSLKEKAEKMGQGISQFLLSVLRCPACGDMGELAECDDHLVCTKCARVFQVSNGIPRMLLEQVKTEGKTE